MTDLKQIQQSLEADFAKAVSRLETAQGKYLKAAEQFDDATVAYVLAVAAERKFKSVLRHALMSQTALDATEDETEDGTEDDGRILPTE